MEMTETVGGIIWMQIPIGVKMRLGMRDGVTTHSSLECRVGPMHPIRKLEISLNAFDLYDIKLSKLKKGSQGFRSWVIEDEYGSVFADSLEEVLLWMESKNWG